MGSLTAFEARTLSTEMRIATGPRHDRVYFIAGAGLIKIGVSRNVPERLSRLQVGSPVRLTLLHAFPGDRALEQRLHGRFAKLHSHGEWFRGESVLLEYIAKCRGFE